jgi:DNA-binding NarL/FixJ family response regulator
VYGPASSAATLLGSIDTLAEVAGAPIAPSVQDNCDRAAAAARASLGDEQFAALRNDGRLLSLQEIVAVAAAIPISTGASVSALTLREVEVLRLVAAGQTDREIAEALFVSYRTVNAHVASILAKLGVANRRAAATLAREQGWLSASDRQIRHT